ncbi:MAG: HD domain-containing protein [Phycisphaerales bacterium]|nr:MAG: HD domain-containing protein [Phycisphaerales bacterium]
MHDLPSIMNEILHGYALPMTGSHGVIHWARVMENGMRLAKETDADQEVVMLFALFHDCRRINEFHDDDHGLRGGEFARSLRGSLVHLDDKRFELLFEACRLHTDGHTEGDPTILTCWDADRLDLGRVGIKPRPDLLCTEAARELLWWAHERAVTDHRPTDTLAAWRVEV